MLIILLMIAIRFLAGKDELIEALPVIILIFIIDLIIELAFLMELLNG